MSEFRLFDRVEYNNEVYIISEIEGNALVVKRPGSRTPISIPKDQAKKIFQEGRSEYNPNKKLNG